jgi:hypothetical protein
VACNSVRNLVLICDPLKSSNGMRNRDAAVLRYRAFPDHHMYSFAHSVVGEADMGLGGTEMAWRTLALIPDIA